MQQVLYIQYLIQQIPQTDDNKKPSVTHFSPIIFDHYKVIIIDKYTKL